MSLHKWKPWPVENLEDMLKIDKKLVTKKIGSYDHFWANFFLNLVKLKMYPEYLSLLLAYSHSKYQMYQVMWTAEIWLGIRWKLAHANSSNGALYVLL